MAISSRLYHALMVTADNYYLRDTKVAEQI